MRSGYTRSGGVNTNVVDAIILRGRSPGAVVNAMHFARDFE